MLLYRLLSQVHTAARKAVSCCSKAHDIVRKGSCSACDSFELNMRSFARHAQSSQQAGQRTAVQ